MLGQLGASLVASTYQAGKVILVRNDQNRLNTHFRDYEKPMGINFRSPSSAQGR